LKVALNDRLFLGIHTPWSNPENMGFFGSKKHTDFYLNRGPNNGIHFNEANSVRAFACLCQPSFSIVFLHSVWIAVHLSKKNRWSKPEF
jgi:hypothetical protein